MSGFAATRPQPGLGTRSAGEYKISLSECRHFARDEFSLSLFFPALTPMSRSEFFPGSGPHALHVMSRPLQPPAPGPRAKCRFLCPSARLSPSCVR